MRVLTRMWQMLLKALEEVGTAPNAMMAAEMAVIRLTHVADLPSPEELVRKLQDSPPPPGGGGGGQRRAPQPAGTDARASHPAQTHGAPSGPVAQLAVAADVEQALARFGRFEDVVALIRHHRDVKLLVEVETGLRLVRYSPGRIEFQPADGAVPDLAQRLGSRLQAWTGNRWAISVVSEGGAPTIAETRDAEEAALRAEAEEHPLVQAVFSAFPKARISTIRSSEDIATEASEEALPEVDEEWDPFEED
jgi:DNA polymerase-3 subunit gamma/tau